MKNVYILVGNDGKIVSVHRIKVEAYTRRDSYNANPWIDEKTPDTAAPYHVEVWRVQS